MVQRRLVKLSQTVQLKREKQLKILLQQLVKQLKKPQLQLMKLSKTVQLKLKKHLQKVQQLEMIVQILEALQVL